MDESDFEHFDDDPKRGKVQKARPTWAIVLLERVRMYVLRETDDFVLKPNLARHFNQSEPVIGSCIAALVREGLLTPLRPVDPKKAMDDCVHRGHHCKCHPRLSVGDESCFWENGRWMVSGSGTEIRTRLRRVRGIRGKPVTVISGKIGPNEKAKWDGRANFIIRGEKFHHECERLGLPVDPRASWTCPRCGKKSAWDKIECGNYNISPPCHYKRPDSRFWPKPVKWRTCERCGTKLAPNTLHKLRHCNVSIVREIMES